MSRIAHIGGYPVWHDDLGDVRVMAVAEGHVMAQRPGCPPFVEPVGEFCLRMRPGRISALPATKHRGSSAHKRGAGLVPDVPAIHRGEA